MLKEDELALVEQALERAVESDVSVLSQASQRIIGSGGKRLRPRLVLLSFKAIGGTDISRALPVAIAVELLHTASLIHDDINDQSHLRRGQISVNAEHGDALALWIGDFVFVKQLELVASLDSGLIQVLAHCCTTIVEGETLQGLHMGDIGVTEEEYLKIIASKTAVLFAACAELGGLVAGGDDDQVRALREYGYNLGMAFQIRDDALDYVGDSVELGKPVASDLKQGTMSLAPLYALDASPAAAGILTSGDTTRVLELLNSTGALEYAIGRANDYAEKAKDALSILPESPALVELCRLADYSVARDQ